MDKSILVNAIHYYDNNNEKYLNLKRKIRYYKINRISGDYKRNIIIFYDKNKEKLFESIFEVIGLYNHISNSWFWGWSIPSMPKNMVYVNRKIVNYAFDSQDILMKNMLLTSRFRINDKSQLDFHIALASYITKNPFIYGLNLSIKEIQSDLIPISNEKYISMYIFILDNIKV